MKTFQCKLHILMRHVAVGCLCVAAAGCGRPVRPMQEDAPIVYDLGTRGELAFRDKTWTDLDLGSSDTRHVLLRGWEDPDNAPDGTPSAWTTQRTAGISLFLAETPPLTLTVTCYPYYRSYLRQGLAVLVNGERAGKFVLPRSSDFRDYTVQIPADLLRKGENLIELKARYASRRKSTAIRVSRLRLRGLDPKGPEGPALSARNDSLRQARDTRVAWRIIVPRAGYLRVRPEMHAAAGRVRGNICLRLRDARINLATYTETEREPALLDLSRWGGRRARLEFEVLGDGDITWHTAHIGGLVQPRDVNVFLFTIDTLREDRVGAYGYDRPTTPALDRLATRGVLFKHAFACSNLSGPSHASILTGRYPQSHGMLINGKRLDPQQIALQAVLQKRGYLTGSYVNFPLLQRADMMGKGFDKRGCVPGTPQSVDLSPDAHNVYARALRWVDHHWQDKFFLWVHSEFLHMLDIPEPYRTMFWDVDVAALKAACDNGGGFFPLISTKESRRLRSAYNRGRIDLTEKQIEAVKAYYDGALRLTDDFLGAFVKALARHGMDPFAAMVITSDHGVSLGQTHRVSHIGPPYDHLLRVPLIFVLPGLDVRRRTVTRSLAESVDIAPTLLSYIGLKPLRRMQGMDLTPCMTGDATVTCGKQAVFATLGYDRKMWYSVRTMDSRYALSSDEDEIMEVHPRSDAEPESRLDDEPERRDRLHRELMQWLKTTPDVARGDTEGLSSEIIEMLKKAGYLDDVQ